MKKGQAIPHALRYLHLNALLLHSAMRTDLYLLQDIIILFFLIIIQISQRVPLRRKMQHDATNKE